MLVNGDLLDEANETYFVNLTNPTNATIADGQGLGTITDDDPMPALSIGDVTVIEGDAGTVDATFTGHAERVQRSERLRRLRDRERHRTRPGDYVARNGQLVFTPARRRSRSRSRSRATRSTSRTRPSS